MSQSATTNTTTNNSQPSASPENKNKTTTAAGKDEAKKKTFSTKPVIPWDHEPHSVNVKSFVGYDIQFTGWTRRDIRAKRCEEAAAADARDAENE
ncbi:hypothetical protein HG536_0H03840 [Torulaspora globosa]|uniref:Uncharacterized protein n=1 Tax=Torulaspora globosa TaxID=48254 RepID=A0A7G3ZNC2_9SACH|nr:uncharacterized protein HG536_0H03840 [Torulaspora globosa]QLL35008.1 hypothetical protein HG536_0H03840 [Torulaspora globosa]